MYRILLTLAILLLSFPHAFAKEPWKEYKSDNFTIYSDLKTKEVKAKISEFEAFRKTALLFLGLEDQPENDQARLFLFKSDKDFHLIAGKGPVAGYYDYTLDGPIMVMGPTKKEEERNVVLFHEYIHYLLRERTSVRYPRWYEEGLCDVLGAAVVSKGKVSIGTSHSWRHWTAQTSYRIDVADLIEEPSPIPRYYYASFYPSSWITTHYLLMGHLDNEPNYTGGLSKYLSLYHNGETDVETFEKTLGISTKDLDKRLNQYAEKEFLVGYNIPVEDYSGKIEIRRLTHNESIYRKADLLTNQGKESKAEYFLKKTDMKAKDAARNLALLAITQGHEEKFDKADSIIEKALKLAPKDPIVLGHATHYYGDKLEYQKDNDNWDEALYTHAMKLGLDAYQQDNKTLRIPRYLAELYKLKDDKVNAIKMLMEVYRATPNRLSLNMHIGEYLAESASPKLAKPFLEKVIAFTHSDKRRKKAQKLLDKINQSEA